jgi:hypothetical protein
MHHGAVPHRVHESKVLFPPGRGIIKDGEHGYIGRRWGEFRWEGWQSEDGCLPFGAAEVDATWFSDTCTFCFLDTVTVTSSSAFRLPCLN